MVRAEHLRADGVEHRGAEGAPALAELDLRIDALGHAGHAGTAEDGTAPQRTRAEFHAPLEPGDRMAVGQYFRDPLRHVVDPSPRRLRRMPLAGGDDLVVAVGRAEVDMLHLLHRHAALHGDPGGRADGRAGIARCRLDEKLPHVRPGNDLLVELDVERATAREGQLAGFAQDFAEVMIDHRKRDILE